MQIRSGRLGASRGSPREVLVTGAAGFIGSHSVLAFTEAGWSVTALDVKEVPASQTGPMEIVRARADAPRVLADLRAGRYAAVVHQGGISNTLEGDWNLLEEVNIRQPLALAQASFAGGARFVYASSHSVYGNIRKRIAVAEESAQDSCVCTGPLNLYARSKITLDREMSERFGAGQPWIALRYTNVFGIGEERKGEMASIISQLLRRAAEDRPLRLFSDTLKACRDYIPVENVTGTVVKIVENETDPGIYNLGSGCPVSFATLLEWCASFKGGSIDLQLMKNPIAERYQYWTCADQSRLHSALHGLPTMTIENIRSAAEQLYRHYARLREPAPEVPA